MDAGGLGEPNCVPKGGCNKAIGIFMLNLLALYYYTENVPTSHVTGFCAIAVSWRR